MVLSDRFNNHAPRGLVARTAMYVVGFGGAALLMALVLSFTFVSLAEAVLPETQAAVEKSKAVKATKAKGVSKKAGSRANQATDSEDDAEGSR